MAFSPGSVINAVIVGTLLAIVWSLRILVLLERRIKRMDENLYKIVLQIEAEELRIEKEEQKIEQEIEQLRPKRKVATKKSSPAKKKRKK